MDEPVISSESASENKLGARFWRAWAGWVAASLGDGITLTVLPLLAIGLTDDARQIAAVAAARFVPFLVLAVPLGALVDRIDRRLAIGISLAVRAVAGLFLAVLVASEAATIWWLVVIAFVIGAGEVVTDSGYPALLRALVRRDQLALANARLAGGQTVANNFVGPLLGAAVFTLNRTAAVIMDAAMFGLAAVFVVTIRGSFLAVRPDVEPRATQRSWTAGLRHVWSEPLLRSLVVAVGWFSVIGSAANAVVVIFAKERLGLSDTGFGILLSMSSVGAILASLVVAPIIQRVGGAGSMRVSVSVWTATSVLMALSTNIYLVGFLFAARGFSDPLWNVVSSTARQRTVPDEIFGRVMSAYLFIAWGMKPIGSMIGGVVAEQWGSEWVIGGAGVGIAMILIFGQKMFSEVNKAMSS